MQDLNSVLFYKAKFNIALVDKSDDLLWKIILHIRDWQTGKWNKDYPVVPVSLRKWTGLKFGTKPIFSENNPDNTTIFIDSSYFKDDTGNQYWACDIMEKAVPPSGFCGREWHTEIGFEQELDKPALFSCVLSYGDIPGFIGPVQETPSASTPRLITNILRDASIKTTLGIDSIPISERKLSVGSWPDFKERLINPEREIPYVFVNADSFDEESGAPVFSIDPKILARALCANAIVFYSGDSSLIEEMEYLEDSKYRCVRGATYVFYPARIAPRHNREDPFRIRYLSTSQIAEYGPEESISFLRRALAQDVNFYDTFFRIDLCRQKIEKHLAQRRLKQIRLQHEEDLSKMSSQSKEEVESIFKEFGEIDDERQREKKRADEAEKKYREEHSENIHLHSRVVGLEQKAERYEKLKTSLQSRFEIKEYPESVEDVVQYFCRVFSDRLVFSDNAIKSLKGCSLHPRILWETLFALSTVMQPLFLNGSPDPYTEFKTKTGIDCARGEGAMTRKDKNMMRQFSITHNGNSLNIEPHITFPYEKQSIHFAYDSSTRQIVVGHCGKHLEIFSSRKMK